MALKWISPEKAQGLEFSFVIPYGTRQVQLVLPQEQHLLIGAGDRWHIKPSGRDRLPLAVNELRKNFPVRVFAPPPDGKNNTPGAYETIVCEPPTVAL